MSAEKINGSCLCGQVQFEVALPSRFVCHCHCDNCRRAHGAGSVTWAGFPTARFCVVSGEESLTRYVTDTGATRSFCARCGSPLTYESPRWEGEVHVAVAALEGSLPDSPKVHVYADRSPDWCPITDDLPQLGGEGGTEVLGEGSV